MPQSYIVKDVKFLFFIFIFYRRLEFYKVNYLSSANFYNFNFLKPIGSRLSHKLSNLKNSLIFNR